MKLTTATAILSYFVLATAAATTTVVSASKSADNEIDKDNFERQLRTRNQNIILHHNDDDDHRQLNGDDDDNRNVYEMALEQYKGTTCGPTTISNLDVTSDLTLTRDYTINGNEGGLQITASDVTLDCGGHSITCLGSCQGSAISASNSISTGGGGLVQLDISGVTIKNCVVKGTFETAVNIGGVDDAKIENVLVDGATLEGISVFDLKKVELKHVVATGTTDRDGIILYKVTDAKLKKAFACNNYDKDIKITNSDDIEFREDIFCGVGKCDVPSNKVEEYCGVGLCDAIL